MKFPDSIHDGGHLSLPGRIASLGVGCLAPHGGNEPLLAILALAEDGGNGPAAVVGSELEHGWQVEPWRCSNRSLAVVVVVALPS